MNHLHHRLGIALLLLASARALAAPGREVPFCQFLDAADEPAWRAAAHLTSSADVQGDQGRAYSVLRVTGGGGLYFAEAPGGALQLGGAYAVHAFEGNGGVNLPDAVADLHLEAGYQWRNWDGRSLEVSARPGFYGEVAAWESSALRIPFDVIGYQALSPRLSGRLGVAVYPGFTRSFDPRFGLRYALADEWTAELGYPASGVTWRDRAGREAYVTLRNDPINEFWLESGDERRAFRFEETRLVLGTAAPLGGTWRLGVEAGYVFQRSVDFARVEPNRSVEDAWVVGLGLSGAL